MSDKQTNMDEKHQHSPPHPLNDPSRATAASSNAPDVNDALPNQSDPKRNTSSPNRFALFFYPAFSLTLLLLGIALDHYMTQNWFTGSIRLAWYLLAYLPVGLPVVRQAVQSIRYSDFFSEFFLMSIATIGAFAIGEYPEGVAVMLFYSVGEVFQSLAVKRAKRNIQSLLDERPDQVTVLRGGNPTLVMAEQVTIGEVIQLKPGEKLGLDGELISDKGAFNTAALTGESMPERKKEGDPIFAGMINLDTVTQVKATTAYADSKLSKILKLVQEATAQKAPTELFIRKFAKVYTPIVVFLALGIAFLPYLFVTDYQFSVWLYRALIFLVISCPCALVVSIPLGYFGGIGASSRHGILIKGSNFLDSLAQLQHIVMDKTGTMTEGAFKVQEVLFEASLVDSNRLLSFINLLESHSTHPIATAIQQYAGPIDDRLSISGVQEISGHGLKGMVENKPLLAGNGKLLEKFNIDYPSHLRSTALTTVLIAYEDRFAGYITIADRIKSDAKATINDLHKLGISVTMLSGDQPTVVKNVAEQLGIDNAYGGLLPEGKVTHLKALKQQHQPIAFVGDGVNDAPVVAISDIGIAMGGLGSDATIETADVVIQDDKLSRIPTAIRIGKQTKRIVWQNISLAFGVKALVLMLGAGGLATLWEAVFADVGVALLAILNTIRIQRSTF